MAPIFIFIILHWYISLFFQSFFYHRYAAHGLCSMSKGWEKFFQLCSYITHGTSYMSTGSYGIMHRLHHAHTDEQEDPHSPHYSPNALTLMWKTRNSYQDVVQGRIDVDEKYAKDLPGWPALDRIAHNWISRVVWALIYTGIFIWLSTEWWHFLFLPLTIASAAFQGLVVNWWAHKFGYENYKMTNTSKNIIPVDLFFAGEAYHNNHHKHPGRANNAVRWFEIDPTYQIMRVMNFLHIIRLKKMTSAD
ncbi:MAG TPA: acyl-CoA desaturase [Chitinophagaceae bacterium]|nr:acyl-CoA desaturase [Chitinophagaceae bacterium]